MIRVRNDHGADVHGIPPGAVADVDDSIPGVQGFLRAKFLVPFDGALTTLADPLSLAIEEIARRGEHLAQQGAELDALRARIAELEALIPASKRTKTTTPAGE